MGGKNSFTKRHAVRQFRYTNNAFFLRFHNIRVDNVVIAFTRDTITEIRTHTHTSTNIHAYIHTHIDTKTRRAQSINIGRQLILTIHSYKS